VQSEFVLDPFRGIREGHQHRQTLPQMINGFLMRRTGNGSLTGLVPIDNRLLNAVGFRIVMCTKFRLNLSSL
jgi:hypothetical protein